MCIGSINTIKILASKLSVWVWFSGALTKNLKVIYGNNLHKKKKVHFLNIISHGHMVLLFTFAAVGVPLSRPWYWQGWHQSSGLTWGELGLPAVSNQVYFEVRDAWTPRAKAATSPTSRIPPPTQPTTSKPLVPQIPSTAVLVPDVAKLHQGPFT